MAFLEEEAESLMGNESGRERLDRRVVNEHLEFMLSRVFDRSLAPEHVEDLRRSGLSDEMIAQQFIRSVPPAMISPLLGFNLPNIGSALLFPFRATFGGFMDHVRVKIFPALIDAKGHGIKYLQRRGSAPRLYFVARCLREVIEGSSPLWVVEGEKKACAVAQLGLPALGIAGVEGWHQAGKDQLLADFDRVRLAGRTVEILPDGDYLTNPNVERSVRRFATMLRARGAKPGVRLLPRELPR